MAKLKKWLQEEIQNGNLTSTCVVTPDDRKNEDCCDYWGAGFAWYKNYGVEYNFCVDGEENASAIYLMQILLLLYIGPMIRLHTEKHLLVFLKKQSKLNRAAFLIIKMHLQKLNQTLFAVGNTRIQERILIFHIRHGV